MTTLDFPEVLLNPPVLDDWFHDHIKFWELDLGDLED